MDTIDTPRFVTKGNGNAIHIAYVYTGNMAGHLATLCDKWGANGAHGSAIRPAKKAEAATCKSCLKNEGVTA